MINCSLWNKVNEIDYLKLLTWVSKHEIIHNMQWNWLKVQIKLIVYIMNLIHDSNEIGRPYC